MKTIKNNNLGRVARNAIAACNAPHFSGRLNGLAEQIAKQYDKWDRSGKDSAEFNKLNTLIRSAGSFGKVWVMRDGTIAITGEKPRGAEPISAYLNSRTCRNKVVCNGIGDCFADAVFHVEKAAKSMKPTVVKSELNEAKRDVKYVMEYDYAESDEQKLVNKSVYAIDKALSDPSEKNIRAARWECEKARAMYDGGSPRRAFWNACVAKNDGRPDWNKFDRVIAVMKSKWEPVSRELKRHVAELRSLPVGKKTASEIETYIMYLDEAIS